MKVIAPELIGFGDRMLSRDKQNDMPCSCELMAVQLLMSGRTLAGLRIFETMRVLDLIDTYSDAQKDSTGIMGFSGGGHGRRLYSSP